MSNQNMEHSVLLSRLSTSFGIRGTALEWFTSYLSGRSQRVSLSGKCSESLQLNQGVPQGSCLGPLLFTLSITNVRRIRKYLSNRATHTVVHALIIGRIDYCNSILYGLPAKQIAKLQRLQNSELPTRVQSHILPGEA